MVRTRILTAFLALVVLGIGAFITAQAVRQGRPRVASSASALPCALTGAYRIDVENSDKLYSAVRGATGAVPFQDQQQFFMDLSIRLTPPDLLAIECTGNRVSVGSSRAEKVTFLADGRLRRERLPDGTSVTSRITMARDTLTFASTGKAEDNLNVVFKSVDGGQKLRVTRRIYADQLAQPVVIQSVYNKLSDRVDWDVYNGRLVAGRTGDPDQLRDATTSVASRSTAGAAFDLRRALDAWIDATNRRDIDRQMGFYMPQMKAFYLARNTTRDAVRQEKNRAFSTAHSIDIHAEDPEIVLQNGGRTAVMRFRKSYRIVDRSRTRSGIVIQELRWQQTPNGWRIFSERDVRVIR
ncbi:MAG TPA: nuclear transport factor 2 family protein [Pyrinomonadaceae bacterium]